MDQSPQLAPIIVGVSGKRFFSKDVEEDKKTEANVTKTLNATYEELDQSFPSSPKILICSGALGTDLIAAEAAAARGNHWQIVLLLPYAVEHHLADFTTPSLDSTMSEVEKRQELTAWKERCEKYENRFLALSKKNENVSIKIAPLLSGEDLKSLDASFFVRDGKNYSVDHRRALFEQNCQLIAESSTILISVSDSTEEANHNKPDGSTARLIYYRRYGIPKEKGRDIAQRSTILRRAWATASEPPGKYLWHMAIDKPEADGVLKRTVLAPVEPTTGDRFFGTGHHATPKASTEPRVTSANENLIVAQRINRLNELILARAKPLGKIEISVDPVSDPVGLLEKYRTVMSPITKRQKRLWSVALGILSILFLGAVLSIETFAKFLPTNLSVLLLYIIMMTAIGLVSFFSSRFRYQENYEDFRALSEMLRVQIAWAKAGIGNRVDREKMQGLAADLARVREFTTTLITYAWIRDDGGHFFASSPAKEQNSVKHTDRPPEWQAVIGDDSDKSAWISGQIAYFAGEERKRARLAHRLDSISWFFFVSSGISALILLVWMYLDKTDQKNALYSLSGLDQSVALLLTGVFVFIYFVVGYRASLPHTHHSIQEDQRIPFLWVAALFGCLFLAAGWALFAIGIPSADINDTVTQAKYSSIVTIAVLTASAGAARFILEKLALEAEALEYSIANRRFCYAHQRIKFLLSDQHHGNNTEDAQRAVYELGKLALSENISWLKSRRERPLTPVVG